MVHKKSKIYVEHKSDVARRIEDLLLDQGASVGNLVSELGVNGAQEGLLLYVSDVNKEQKSGTGNSNDFRRKIITIDRAGCQVDRRS